MNFRRTKAVTRKEFIHVMRDSRSLAMALAVPFLLLLLFGYALSLDVDNIPTIIYDQDHTPQSRDLINLFAGNRYFQVIGYVDRYQDIESKINNGECLIGVVIPRDYGRKIEAGKQADVQILLDGGEANTGSIALGYAQAMLLTYGADLRAQAMNVRGGIALSSPVDSGLRVWYNEELKSRNFIVPGLIAIILMIVGSLLTTLTIAREWESGTMEQLLSTPVRPAELVGGKMIAYFAIGIVDLVIAVALSIFLFKVPFRGNLLFMGVSACLF
ncbi:MAG: ABC transporter permease, partial [Blastocatellia bacterium]